MTLYLDPAATLDDLREAVTTLEDVERTARRVFGGAHPFTASVEVKLRAARAALRARETPPTPLDPNPQVTQTLELEDRVRARLPPLRQPI